MAARSRAASPPASRELLPDALYRKAEAAARLGISLATLERRMRDGSIGVVHLGHAARIPGHELLRIIGPPA